MSRWYLPQSRAQLLPVPGSLACLQPCWGCALARRQLQPHAEFGDPWLVVWGHGQERERPLVCANGQMAWVPAPPHSLSGLGFPPVSERFT